VYQQTDSPETFLGHVLGEEGGFLVTFTGQQARISHGDARLNELTAIRQRSWSYPDKAQDAARYLLEEAAAQRDAYVGVHLFREAGNRLAANAAPTARSLWLDEDEGTYPEIGPQPTAVVFSSANRRHLYWRLTQAVTIEWTEAMNRRIAIWAGGDTGKAGAASVLRVPGTGNYKRHPRVDLVAMEITHTSPWEPEIMDQAVPPLNEPPRLSGGVYDGPELELAQFLEGVEVLGEVSDGLGKKLAIVCPWIEEHSGGDRSGTFVGHRADGGLWFHCNHQHCQGRTWRDFRKMVHRSRSVSVDLPGYTGPTLNVEIRYDR